jgi:hypothetical protein
MKKLIILFLLVPFVVKSQTITLSNNQLMEIKSTATGNNIKIINSYPIANITDTLKVEIPNLQMFHLIEIQVDWKGLTGTLNSKIMLQQRDESSMNWVCIQPVETDPGNMVETITATTGSYPFILWAWCASDLRILFIRNGVTGGYLNTSIGIRR